MGTVVIFCAFIIRIRLGSDLKRVDLILKKKFGYSIGRSLDEPSVSKAQLCRRGDQENIMGLVAIDMCYTAENEVDGKSIGGRD